MSLAGELESLVVAERGALDLEAFLLELFLDLLENLEGYIRFRQFAAQVGEGVDEYPLCFNLPCHFPDLCNGFLNDLVWIALIDLLNAYKNRENLIESALPLLVAYRLRVLQGFVLDLVLKVV